MYIYLFIIVVFLGSITFLPFSHCLIPKSCDGPHKSFPGRQAALFQKLPRLHITDYMNVPVSLHLKRN